jgi:hypothetical protein
LKKLEKENYKYFQISESYFDKMTFQQLEDLGSSDGDAKNSFNFKYMKGIKEHHVF